MKQGEKREIEREWREKDLRRLCGCRDADMAKFEVGQTLSLCFTF